MNGLFNFSELDKVLLIIGAWIGAASSFLFGAVDEALAWLFLMVVADYVTGTWAALSTGKWSSSAGLIGISRKAFIFFLVALCHGVDVTSVIPFVSVRDICVFSIALNETGSILENIERAGYGRLIPPVVQRAMDSMSKKNEKLITQLAEEDKPIKRNQNG